jgi:wyosine [tRNA(Phe)-imidazoG37] synthetase (radical SAM superfamily)
MKLLLFLKEVTMDLFENLKEIIIKCLFSVNLCNKLNQISADIAANEKSTSANIDLPSLRNTLQQLIRNLASMKKLNKKIGLSVMIVVATKTKTMRRMKRSTIILKKTACFINTLLKLNTSLVRFRYDQ